MPCNLTIRLVLCAGARFEKGRVALAQFRPRRRIVIQRQRHPRGGNCRTSRKDMVRAPDRRPRSVLLPLWRSQSEERVFQHQKAALHWSFAYLYSRWFQIMHENTFKSFLKADPDQNRGLMRFVSGYVGRRTKANGHQNTSQANIMAFFCKHGGLSGEPLISRFACAKTVWSKVLIHNSTSANSAVSERRESDHLKPHYNGFHFRRAVDGYATTSIPESSFLACSKYGHRI